MELSNKQDHPASGQINIRSPIDGGLTTAGGAALGGEVVARIVKAIAVYDDFCCANDLSRA
jgi:hypothetical protein